MISTMRPGIPRHISGTSFLVAIRCARLRRACDHHVLWWRPAAPGFAALAITTSSTDPRQRITDEHVDDSRAAEPGPQHDSLRRLGDDFPDLGRIGTQRMRPQRGEPGPRPRPARRWR